MKEPIRFRHDTSSAFPAVDVTAIDLVTEVDDLGRRNRAFQITTTFLGLLGSDTPLPTQFTGQRGEENDTGTSL